MHDPNCRKCGGSGRYTTYNAVRYTHYCNCSAPEPPKPSDPLTPEEIEKYAPKDVITTDGWGNPLSLDVIEAIQGLRTEINRDLSQEGIRDGAGLRKFLLFLILQKIGRDENHPEMKNEPILVA